tara:strand:- start:43 stop:531 length:489 start_codon:yes stop_codon:yes gene_type:complete
MDTILIDAKAIRHLDLSPLSSLTNRPLKELLELGSVLELRFIWPRESHDPRELAECPEPRLWALRADGSFPWLPMILEREKGSLVRHVAMVVPHSFNSNDGLRFEPQALELWITHRLMQLDTICRNNLDKSLRGNLTQMAAALGYELDSKFWKMLDQVSKQQ